MMPDARLHVIAAHVGLFLCGDTGALRTEDVSEMLAEIFELRTQVAHLITVQHQTAASLWAASGRPP